MTTMTVAAGDMLHRLVKQALDSGAAASLADAQELFRGYRVAFSIGPNEARESHHQAALLTAIALARRVFLGGVTVQGAVEVPLRTPLPLGATLADAIAALGAVVSGGPDGVPLVTIGGGPQPRKTGFHIRTAYAGWRGGIIPAHSELAPTGSPPIPLAAMLAAALAINEAFLHVSGAAPVAGRRVTAFSLWRPPPQIDWLVPATDEPELHYLPSRLWLLGLGHLGQAYMWALGLLPYPDPADLLLVLQDVDVITPSTESTSVLSDSSLVGLRKTRAVAAWAERRGFLTAIHERLFDATFRRRPDEPAVALCGLDNAVGRRALDQVGFEFVVEAGLGRGHRDFRTIRLHTLPASRAAVDIWKMTKVREEVGSQPAYQKMLDDRELDRCGVTLLAGKAVGAAFVGAVAACLGIAEVLRLLHAGPLYELIDLDLESVEQRLAVPHSADFGQLNPGYVST